MLQQRKPTAAEGVDRQSDALDGCDASAEYHDSQER
jgi:hypothetical protein